MSLLEELEAESPPPAGKRAPVVRGTNAQVTRASGLFDAVRDVDTVAVLDWLGIEHDDKHATCPGCSEPGALIGKDGGLKCLHNRCSSVGPPGFPGFRSNVDIVTADRRCAPLEAAKAIAERFGIEVGINVTLTRDARVTRTVEPPEDDFGPTDGYDDWSAPSAHLAENSFTSAERMLAPRTGETISSVLDSWAAWGPLVHEPTGIPRLDELTGGGPVYGTRWYLAGAPDAGKTAVLVHLAHNWAERGVTVGLLAVDEEPADMVARLAQRRGYRRPDTEIRDAETLERMATDLSGLPIRFYDGSWTIEEAAADLRATAGDARAALLIDSVQTVHCLAERAAEREVSEVQAVTARTRAIRAVATTHKLIAVATSELGRSAYATDEARRTVSTLAAGKWSGAIEYSARVLIGLRSVADETDVIDLELAKNKHGPTREHVHVRLDRPSQSLWQVDYEGPDGEEKDAERVTRIRRRVAEDAERVAAIIEQHSGLGMRDLYARGAEHGLSKDRVNAGLTMLGSRVIRGVGPRNSTPLSLNSP